MKIGNLVFKKEYVLYHFKPETQICFCDEPVADKKNLLDRIEMLKKEKAKIIVKKRFIIEI
jgi:hypothetical protein